jgi:hypothetical protein
LPLTSRSPGLVQHLHLAWARHTCRQTLAPSPFLLLHPTTSLLTSFPLLLDPLSRTARRGHRSVLQRQPQESAGYASPRSGSTSMPPAPTCKHAAPTSFLLLGSSPSSIVALAVPLIVICAGVQEPLGPRPPSSVPSAAATPPRSCSSPTSSRDHDGLRVVRVSSGSRIQSRGSLLLLPPR